MRDALGSCGAGMLGGDVGTADQWRFTGVGIGSCVGRPEGLNRVVEIEAGGIYTTGCFGDGNLAAVGGAMPRFEIRLPESKTLVEISLSARGVACIDSSDGLFRALETLRALNTKLNLTVDLAAIPLAEGVATMARRKNIPAETFLMGSAGEYELLTLAPDQARRKLENNGWRRIGDFCEQNNPGLFYRRNLQDGSLIKHSTLPDPRDAASIDAYRETLIRQATEIFVSGGANHALP